VDETPPAEVTDADVEAGVAERGRWLIELE
jgi:hypothetical protein